MMRSFHQYSIPALWVAWLLYWSIAAIGAKANRREESFASRLSHIVPLALGIALLATLHVPFAWLVVRILPPSAGSFWLGLALVGLGLAFSVAGRVRLGNNWSAAVTLKQDHELIRSGPYRWVRHPIYTGRHPRFGDCPRRIARIGSAGAGRGGVPAQGRHRGTLPHPTIRRSLRTLSRRSPGIDPDAKARILNLASHSSGSW
jgi:hypothetical protein